MSRICKHLSVNIYYHTRICINIGRLMNMDFENMLKSGN